MAFKTWASGDVLTASDLNTFVAKSPSLMKIQAGTVSVTMTSVVTATSAVTFPVAFSGAPVVIVGTQYNTSGGTQFVAGVDSTTGDPTTTGFTVRTTFVSGSSNTVTAKCWWVAIGT